MEDIFDFSRHLLTLRSLKESFVESLNIFVFFGVSPSLSRSCNISNWSRLINPLPDSLNISPFLLDFFLSSLVDGDLKEFLEVIKMLIEILVRVRVLGS